MRQQFFLFACLLLPCFCSAQDSPEFKKCGDKAMTQAAINTCAVDEARRVDDELNRVYGQLLSSVKDDANATAKIRAAEKAWIAYRDAYIEAMYPAEDKATEYGSMYAMDVNLLMAKLTRQQIDALKEILKENSPDGKAK